RTQQRNPGRLEGLSALAPGACRRAVSFLSVVERELRFLRKDLARPAGVATALEALHGKCRRGPGRSAGPGVRGEIFQSAGEARGLENGEGNRGRNAAGHQLFALDVRGYQAAGAD